MPSAGLFTWLRYGYFIQSEEGLTFHSDVAFFMFVDKKKGYVSSKSYVHVLDKPRKVQVNGSYY